MQEDQHEYIIHSRLLQASVNYAGSWCVILVTMVHWRESIGNYSLLLLLQVSHELSGLSIAPFFNLSVLYTRGRCMVYYSILSLRHNGHMNGGI